jgi:glycosyltransferase involved in cell wall biosynthesis
MKGDPTAEAPRLVLFGGQYRWHEERVDESRSPGSIPDGRWDGDPGKEQSPHHQQHDVSNSVYQTHELEPYSRFSRFLLESAHIGLEVAHSNIERRYSQSFRSLEFLRHGLPLICNEYLPIASLVSQYQAGWTIREPEELVELLRNIMDHPDEWQRRSENAMKLVEEVLNPDVAVRPLLDWLELPAKAPHLPSNQPQAAPVVLGKPAWPERLKRQLHLLKRVVLSRLFRTATQSPTGDHIVVVTRGDLFPDDHGAAVKIIETARGLSQHGRKVGIVSDDRKYWWLFENGDKQRQRFPFWLRLLSLPRSLSRLLHFSKELPESNSFLYLPLTDSSFFWHCLYAGRQLNAGILQAEFPAYAKPCIDAREILNAAVVLVEHNVEYARLKAQVTELSEDQYRNLRAIEIDLCNRSDAVVCVSDNDRQRLLRDGVKPELLNTIPHGYDPEPFKLPAKKSLRAELGLANNAVLIAFHGTFSYPPNRDALRVFAEILLPQLASGGNPFHLIAIGRNPPAKSPHPNIHFTGSVDFVGPWLKGCDLAVIPLREGGGTRMKIIDCFAAGLPVISTSKGIEGIPVVNGREALIIDDWLSMTNEIIGLAESEERRQQLSAAALDFASEMDWKSIGKRYLGVFSGIQRAAK